MNPVVKDLGSFTLNKAGRTWNVTMPQQFTKAEIAFYRGDLSEQTLNPAWEGHLQINGKNVVKFLKGKPPTTFVFQDFTTGTAYEVKNEYKKTEPRRYLDVSGFLRPGDNEFYYYHEQRPDLAMGVVLRNWKDSPKIEPVELRITVTKEGECRVILGRSMPDEEKQAADALTPITSWLSSRTTQEGSANQGRGSLVVRASDPKQPRGMLVYPGALRFPCTLSLDITELRDARLGIQFVSSSCHLEVYVESENGLRASATLRAQCGNIGQNQKLTKVERSVQLSRPDEVRFQLPQTEQQLAQLITLDALIFPSNPTGPEPSGSINNVVVKARKDRSLGLGLKVDRGQVVVERIEPDGLAAAAGIRIGDILVAVNDQKTLAHVDAWSLPGIAMAVILPRSKVLGVRQDVHLSLRRSGEEKAVTIQQDEVLPEGR